MKIISKIKELGTQRWALGFVRGGMDAVMQGASPIGDCRLKNEDRRLKIGDWRLEIDWVKMPEDRWFADPFILDVMDDEILLLVEDYAYAARKGVISLLHINRANMEITSRKVLLELPTHLSFPAIWRNDGHIYVYPESALSGRLDMYEFHPQTETLTFVKTICDDVVWDSYITEAFGEPLMFTAAHNDNILDIYKWDDKKERFISNQQIASENPNSRMGGAVFEYKGEWYYPAQNCETTYGGAIDIKRLNVVGGKMKVEGVVKHIESMNKRYPTGLHTLNEYKGVVVIDVLGYRYGKLGSLVAKMVKLKKKLK